MKKYFHTLLPYLPSAVLLIILCLGAYLRLYRIPEYMTYLGDEGRDMLVVKRMIVDHKFTLLGPNASVGGFFLGPIYYYFMLPFVWAWNMDPSGAAVMVALFGIATVYVVYRFGSEAFEDRSVGLIAAALYALSPLVIAYSRSSWNPNLVPFFATMAMYFAWKSVVKDEPKLLFWIGICCGIGLQLHYLFLFLLPVIGVWYLIYGRTKEWIVYYLAGIAGFLIGYGPFLAFELRHGFPNSIAIYNFLRSGDGTGLDTVTFWKNVGDVSYRVFGRLVYRLPPPEQMVNIGVYMRNAWHYGTLGAMYVSILLLLSGIRGKKTEIRKRSVVFLLWFVIPIVLFGFYKKAIYDYYFGILFTVPFFMTAMILARLGTRVWGRIGMAVVVIFLLWLNWEGRPFRFIPNNQLAQARSIAQYAYGKTDGKPYNFALMANFNSDHAYRYFFELWGNPPVTIENFENDPGRKSVTDQLIVICELPECKPLGSSLWEIAGFGRAEIAGEWQVSFVKVQRLVHYTGKD